MRVRLTYTIRTKREIQNAPDVTFGNIPLSGGIRALAQPHKTSPVGDKINVKA